MAASLVPETDLARITRWCAEESPERYSDELRVEHHVRGRTVTLCETRAPWDGQGEWTHLPIAQVRFRADTSDWSLHWADRNGRWHPYDMGSVQFGSIAELLAEIDDDPTFIFRG